MKFCNVIIALVVIWNFPLYVIAQVKKIVVPNRVSFADMRLHLTPKACERVQKKVNSLVHSPKDFQILLNRANLWFPLIERTLKEEEVPNDFKYLPIQESALISNIVCPANDVGFWQIRDITARGLSIKINHPIDERMHITTSTRAAARFLKDNYRYFRSWLGALLAYNRGRRGAEKKFPKKNYGVKSIKIEDKADVYIIHFIAHKLAFEQLAGKGKHPKLHIYEYKKPHGKTLQDIAKTFSVEESLLKKYNAWLKCRRIPYNTPCSVILPMAHNIRYKASRSNIIRAATNNNGSDYGRCFKNEVIDNKKIDSKKYLQKDITFPKITPYRNNKSIRIVKINGIPGIVGQEGDSIEKLIALGKVSLNKFLIFNEINKDHHIVPEQVYYYASKKNKGGTHYHIVQTVTASIWKISQKYGIKTDILLSKNRMSIQEPLELGRVLWLRFIRPKDIPVSYELSG